MAAVKPCLALAISIALFSLAYSQPPGDYHSFCQKTSMANICTQTIDEFTSNVKLKVNAQGWLRILNFRAVAFDLFTRIRIGDAIRSKPGADLKYRLTVCNNFFDDAYIVMNGLDWTLLNHSNYAQYNRLMGTALGGINQCIDYFNLPPPILSPVAIYTQTTLGAIKLVLEGLNVFQCNKRTACT